MHKAQFRRRTSHVPYQVVRGFSAVVQCPNELFRQISIRQANTSGYGKACHLRAAVPKYRLEVWKMKKSKIPKLCQNIGVGKLFLGK